MTDENAEPPLVPGDMQLGDMELGDADDAWYGMIRAYHRISAELDAVLLKYCGFGTTWYEILVWLSRQRRPVRVSRLASVVILSPSRVSRVLDAMEKRGLVARANDPDDARATVVRITDAGEELHRQARREYETALNRAFLDLLTEEESAAFTAVWRKLGTYGAPDGS